MWSSGCRTGRIYRERGSGCKQVYVLSFFQLHSHLAGTVRLDVILYSSTSFMV